MKDKLIKYANDLITTDNVLPIYEDLVQIFDENDMFHEEGGCLERIWHITQDHNIYKQMGDIFLNKVRNRDIAFASYNKYLQFTQPEFYKNYAENLYKLGYENFKYEPDYEDYTREVINLCDRYHVIVYISMLLAEKQEYDAILEIADCLKKLKTKIEELKICGNDDKATIEELKDSDNYLSYILSGVHNNNDINSFALELNPENEQAFINITEDFIMSDKKEEALDFYNNNAENFNRQKVEQPDGLCWAVSDYYRGCQEFYNAVLFQKYAIESIDASKE